MAYQYHLIGSNLRKTMLRTGNDRVDDIRIKDINRIVYQDIPNGSDWIIEMVKEIGEYNFGSHNASWF